MRTTGRGISIRSVATYPRAAYSGSPGIHQLQALKTCCLGGLRTDPNERATDAVARPPQMHENARIHPGARPGVSKESDVAFI